MASSSQATVVKDNKEIGQPTNPVDPADQSKNIKGNDNANVPGQKDIKTIIPTVKDRLEALAIKERLEALAVKAVKAVKERLEALAQSRNDQSTGEEVQKLWNDLSTVEEVQKQVQKLRNDQSTVEEVQKLWNDLSTVELSTVEEVQKLWNDLSTVEEVQKQVQKLRNDLTYIGNSLNNLVDNPNTLNQRIQANSRVLVNALERGSEFEGSATKRRAEGKQLKDMLDLLNKVVKKLKHQISSNKLSPTDSNTYKDIDINEFDYSQVLDILPVLHLEGNFKNSPAFRDFRQVYESLAPTTKLCLLCFAIIPENEIVKKRFMTYWWVGEGFVSPQPEKTYKEVAEEIFKELETKGCIESEEKKFRDVADSCKMDPFIRSAVIVLAKEAGFFDFDDEKGNPTAKFMSSYRACLVDGFSQELVKSTNDPEKLQVIFNVNEPYPDIYDWEGFSKLKNVKVLYLGRWQTSAKHHIEVEPVEGIDFLAGLKSMKLLRFLSLQGVSRIIKLPLSVCKLPNLRLLDLRACHNLEALPDWIGVLRRLTHLDISECYLLDSMPKGICALSELQVLKGFVISNENSSRKNCTLDDLVKLQKLRKLSIYINTRNQDVSTLLQFNTLKKLTITWGAGAFPTKAKKDESEDAVKQEDGVAQPKTAKTCWGEKKQDKAVAHQTTDGVFKKLEKLDLKCYPSMTAPDWLLPKKLPKLEKLYIRGGNLQNLSLVQDQNDKWPNVKVLRLKFLSEFKMDWKKLRSSFPDLVYLEKFNCPNLTYFPRNEKGVIRLRP